MIPVLLSSVLLMGTPVSQKPPKTAKGFHQVSKRLDGLYLDLPKSYAMPPEVQAVFKARVQGTKDLEDQYSKYLVEKNRLCDWFSSQLETSLAASESSHTLAAQRYLARLMGLQCESLDDLTKKHQYWLDQLKACDAGLRDGSVSPEMATAAEQEFDLYDQTLKDHQEMEKLRADESALKRDIELIKGWRSSR